MKKALLLCMFIPSVLNAQIWYETFNGLANGATSDAGSTSWSTTVPSGGSGSFSKQTPVTGYQLFLVNNTGTEGVWTSQSIDISAYSEVALEVELYSFYTFSTDYIRCYYKINGGSEVLFGELLGSNGLSITSAASAIVSGNTVQIVIRAMDNTSGTTNYMGLTIPNSMAFENVTVTNISILYSISSGNWNNNNTWSTTGFNGSSCGCTPTNSHRVVIGNNRTVSIPSAATAAGITIENTGRLQFTGNTALTMARGGTINIKSGGTMSRNGMNSSSLVYNAYTYNLIVDGSISIGSLDANAGASLTLTGGGSLDIADDFLIGSGRTITNNLTGEIMIGDELQFENSSSNATFINNGALTVNDRILFNGSNITLTNNGTISATSGGLVVNDNADDGSLFSNASGAVLNVSSINANSADFTLRNSGTIYQTGNFSNISAACRFENLDGSTWNFGGGGTNARLFCSNGSNTFNYNAPSAQTIYSPADGAYSNLTLSGSGVKSTSGNLDVSENITIENTARLDVTSSLHAINIGGDWIVTSTDGDPFIQRTGTVTFDGTGDQHISTALAEGETFYTAVVNKVAGNVVMSGSTDMTISNALSLTNGGVDLNGKTLHITNSAVNAITRSNGFIKSENTTAPYGELEWTVGSNVGTYIFPFGKNNTASGYIPFTFDVTSAGTGASGTVTLSTYATSSSNTPLPAGVTNVNSSPGVDNSSNTVDRFWYITLNSYTSNPVTTVTFTATADEIGSLSFLKAQRWNSNTSAWDAPLANQTNPTAYSVRVPGVNNFSPWTLSGNNVVLPVSLVSFETSLENDAVYIEWITAQESESDFFTVEKTRDLRNYVPVAKVKAAGTSKTKRVYSVTDQNPYPGKYYYRLKQTDMDGSNTYSKPVMVEFGNTSSPVFDVFPVPSDGHWIEVSIAGLNDAEKVPIAIYDSGGKAVYSSFIDQQSGQLTKKLIFNNSLEPGIYTIKAGRTQNMTRKIVIE